VLVRSKRVQLTGAESERDSRHSELNPEIATGEREGKIARTAAPIRWLRQRLVSISAFFIASARRVPRSFPVSCRSCVPSRAGYQQALIRCPTLPTFTSVLFSTLKEHAREIKRSAWSAARKGGELSLSVCCEPPRRRPQREPYTFSSIRLISLSLSLYFSCLSHGRGYFLSRRMGPSRPLRQPIIGNPAFNERASKEFSPRGSAR